MAFFGGETEPLRCRRAINGCAQADQMAHRAVEHRLRITGLGLDDDFLEFRLLDEKLGLLGRERSPVCWNRSPRWRGAGRNAISAVQCFRAFIGKRPGLDGDRNAGAVAEGNLYGWFGGFGEFDGRVGQKRGEREG